MWSCGFQSKHPVELVFHFPGVEAGSSESCGLSKITVWNYNRGIKVSQAAASIESTRLANNIPRVIYYCIYCSHIIGTCTTACNSAKWDWDKWRSFDNFTWIYDLVFLSRN